ncbi:MAG: ABC transporter substrate-binding protein [Hyphomicrobiaceae bacterium]
MMPVSQPRRALNSNVFLFVLLFLTVLALFIYPLATSAKAQTNARPQEKSTPLTIEVFVSSDANRCFNPGLVQAIRHFTSREVEQINRDNGIHGRAIKLIVTDDFENAEETVTNVETALNNENLLAMIGVPSSTRGRVVFDRLGQRISQTKVPFITEISLNKIFQDHPNVFTMASAVDTELETVRAFIKNGGYQRPVFVGVDNDLYSFALGDGVKDIPGGPGIVGDYQVPVRNYRLDPAASQRVVDDIKAKDPDLLLMAIHSGPTAMMMEQLSAVGLNVPVFVMLGRITTIQDRWKGETEYGGEIFQMAREGVPNVYNERLRRRIWRARDDTWIFDDIKNTANPAWQNGDCEEKNNKEPRRIFDGGNTRAIGRGTQYRDMLQLIVDAARSAPSNSTIEDYREHIGTRLRGFTEGRFVLKGLWQDWAFTSERTAAGDTLIISKPKDDNEIILSPKQYTRVNGTIQPQPVVYLSLDLIGVSRIDTNDQSFDAEFYLSLKSPDNDIGVKQIEFTNAYRSQSGQGRLVEVRQIHDGSSESNFPTGTKLYKVSGKFTFEPNLSSYPFDKQRLSVSFQAASTARSFLIQPPPAIGRKANITIDGWRLDDQYVGSDQDIIPTIDRSLSERRIVPFYKFNATWVVQRVAVDYYLRVVIPLGFILLVTYFSVFLRHNRFESIMAIQVTALLSSIALYLALPKVDSDQATLSDQIFILTYAAVSIMIGLSILRENYWPKKITGFGRFVLFVQWIVFPITTLVVAGYLITSATGETLAIATRLGEIVENVVAKVQELLKIA